MYSNRYYQSEAEFAIYDYFGSGKKGNPVVAMPTGTGKSIVIANFITNLFRQWPTQRVMMLTHVKELIKQNAEKLIAVWPNAPMGIYSAGLKSREMIMPVVFGGVQSVAKAIVRSADEEGFKPEHLRHFGFRDLLLIDEAHLLSPKDDTMYQFVISELMKINPNLRVVGFTATPYRLKQGMITDDGLFTHVCYDITGVEAFNRLIAEGYISPLIPKRTRTEIDVSSVGIVGGDFNNKELASAVDTDQITYAAVKETIELGYDRKCWLVFCAGIKNAEHVASMLQMMGVSAAVSHSKLSDEENNKRIDAFKSGQLRALVNNDKFTTGFDHPPIDLIVMLRPTLSPGLWVQMLGRGTRPSEGKTNCLVLDFAGNTRRLGPINDPVKPRKAGKGTGDAPIRICEACGVYNHASARACCNCGAEFSFEQKILATAGTEALLRSDAPIVEVFPVQKVLYALHSKEGSAPTMKVSYFSGLRMFNEWICFEHSGLPAKKAKDWWTQRHDAEWGVGHNVVVPTQTFKALELAQFLRRPRAIRVWVNKQYPEILGYEF